MRRATAANANETRPTPVAIWCQPAPAKLPASTKAALQIAQPTMVKTTKRQSGTPTCPAGRETKVRVIGNSRAMNTVLAPCRAKRRARRRHGARRTRRPHPTRRGRGEARAASGRELRRRFCFRVKQQSRRTSETRPRAWMMIRGEGPNRETWRCASISDRTPLESMKVT
jgi:hypothetical protein